MKRSRTVFVLNVDAKRASVDDGVVYDGISEFSKIELRFHKTTSAFVLWAFPVASIR